MADNNTNQSAGSRPMGVTLICLLGFAQAIISIIGSLLILTLSSAVGGIGAGTELGAAFGMLGALFSLFSLIPLAIAFVLIIAFVLLWKMKRVGWILVVLLEIISLLFASVGLLTMNIYAIIGFVLALVILIYLIKNKSLFK